MSDTYEMNFASIDVETANADMATICQIGIAKYTHGELTGEWVSYVDPEDYFDDINVSIHGIDESTVRGAPKFPELTDKLRSLLEGTVVVCHTHFDRVAIHKAAQRYSVNIPECIWLDSAMVARRTWPECSRSGYGLLDVCFSIGYVFKHHDALEDAKAAANIVFAASREKGLDIYGWLVRVRQDIDPQKSREGDPEGPFFGEVIVFTGALEIPRREASDMAAKIGCNVEPGVTKNTTILVVGDQDIKKLAGHEKSSKHRKAEDLIKKGKLIRIVSESDFKEMVKIAGNM
jgi:DNA polymerase III subunit epsilon